MEREQKIQFISAHLAKTPDEFGGIKQDVKTWSDEELDDYLYENFQHDKNEDYD